MCLVQKERGLKWKINVLATLITSRLMIVVVNPEAFVW